MAKISGVGVIAIAGGGLLLYSALNGKAFSSEIRTLLAGGNPSSAQTANPINVYQYNPGGSLNQEYSGTPTLASGASETQFIKSLLLSIGAPTTQANINSLAAWISKEGPWGTQGGNGNNPLNTSITNSPGYIGKWSLAPVVSMFDTLGNGLVATRNTLLGGNYSDIVAALRSGNGLCGQSYNGLSTWSSGGYSQVC